MAVRRFKYRMHHTWVTTCRVGQIMPIFCQEVTPGDTWSGRSMGLIRLAPMDVPAFIHLNCHVHFFFTPHRLVFPEFEAVITGEDTVTTWPVIARTDTASVTNLHRAFGVGPAQAAGSYNVSALPIRAYNLIFNEFFTDQDFGLNPGEDSLTVRDAYHKATSYHASFRTEIQQGNEETIDTSGPTLGVTAIRDAFHRQKFRERRSQFGHRYTDYLMAMGISVPDSRLDRPEHVASGKAVIGVSEVVATATSASENTGDYRGHGIGGVQVPFRKRMFVEHGTLIGLMVMRPRLQCRHQAPYQWFAANSKDALFQQELNNNTQVPMYVGEIESKSVNRFNTYGYQRRYDWLRKPVDILANGMQDAGFASWHFGREFGGTEPSQENFLQVEDVDQIWQDQTANAQQIYAYFDHQIGKRSIIPRAPR